MIHLLITGDYHIEQNGLQYADNISECISLNENIFLFWFKFHWNWFPKIYW